MGLSKKSLWFVLSLVCLPALAGTSSGADIPPWLPRYHLDIRLDVARARVRVRQFVTWYNRHQRPATDLIFNAHAHYSIRPDEIGFGAKTLEILRMAPHEGLTWRAPRVERCWAQRTAKYLEESPLRQDRARGNRAAGESIVVELVIMRLPPKQGRWGQWNGVTFLPTGFRFSRF